MIGRWGAAAGDRWHRSTKGLWYRCAGIALLPGGIATRLGKVGVAMVRLGRIYDGVQTVYNGIGGFREIARGNYLGGALRLVSAALSGRAGITEGLAGSRVTIQSAHGARHLAGTGLTSEAVESAIVGQVRQATAGATATGSFWGRVTVNGRVVEYRAFTVPDKTINVGTYYPVNP